MESYRIVLANEPRLLRRLLHYAFAKAAGVEVVDEVVVAPTTASTTASAPASRGAFVDAARLSDAVAQARADWVIVSLWHNGNLPPPIEKLIDAQPGVSVMGMAADGSRVKVYEPGKNGAHVIHDLSLSDLLRVLRSPRPGLNERG